MEAAQNPNIRVAVIDSPYGNLPELLDDQLSKYSNLPALLQPRHPDRRPPRLRRPHRRPDPDPLGPVVGPPPAPADPRRGRHDRPRPPGPAARQGRRLDVPDGDGPRRRARRGVPDEPRPATSAGSIRSSRRTSRPDRPGPMTPDPCDDADLFWMRRRPGRGRTRAGGASSRTRWSARSSSARAGRSGSAITRGSAGRTPRSWRSSEAGDAARGATLYVTLEPCCHHGKTPPCTDAVLAAGVARVVVAMADPFPKVAGGGLAVLREAGVAVEVGLEADAAAAAQRAVPEAARDGPARTSRPSGR